MYTVITNNSIKLILRAVQELKIEVVSGLWINKYRISSNAYIFNFICSLPCRMSCFPLFFLSLCLTLFLQQSLGFYFCLFLFLSVSVSQFLYLSVTVSQFLSLSISLSQSLSFSFSISLSQSQSLSLSLCICNIYLFYFSLQIKMAFIEYFY